MVGINIESQTELEFLVSDLLVHLRGSSFCDLPCPADALSDVDKKRVDEVRNAQGGDVAGVQQESLEKFLPDPRGEDDSHLAWQQLETEALACQACRLAGGRQNVVFGVGQRVHPKLVFVGEGPGAEEDLKGEPFVGKAGQLLTKAITNGMKLSREQVYICNVVKCRPPENRNPLPDEISQCLPFLVRQLELLRPRVIVLLGSVATKALLGNDIGGITSLRGKWLDWRGIRVMPTFHPSYLLRTPSAKRAFWDDLQLVMKEIGI